MAKRKIPRAYFDNIEHISTEDLEKLNALKTLLKDQVPKSIELAIVSKKTFASVFEINDSNNFVEIHKKDWIPALDTCIRWHVESGEENWEYCSHMAKIVESLKEKQIK